MKFEELKQKVFNKKTEKNVDYRFKIYGKIQTTLKACKLFLIQRIVKKIKDIKKDTTKQLTSEQEINLTELDKQLKNTKKISSDDLKVLAFFIFKWDFHLMIKSNQDQEGLITQQFQKMLDKLKLDWEGIQQDFMQNEQNIPLNQFYKSIQSLKKFKEVGEFKNKMIGEVQKKIGKNKDRKKKIKNKTIMSKQELQQQQQENQENEQKEGGEDSLQKELKQFMEISKQEIEEEDLKEQEDKKQKKFKKEFNSNKYTKMEVEPKSKKPFNKTQSFSKNEYKPSFQKKEEPIDPDIHPSWAAALERKNAQKTVQFQGQKKKLC